MSDLSLAKMDDLRRRERRAAAKRAIAAATLTATLAGVAAAATSTGHVDRASDPVANTRKR